MYVNGAQESKNQLDTIVHKRTKRMKEPVVHITYSLSPQYCKKTLWLQQKTKTTVKWLSLIHI